MGQRISSCLYQHRKKFVVFGGVVGGFVILNSYMRSKFVEWERKKTLEYFDQLKRQSHFDGTLQTCDCAIISFVQKIRERICETLDVNPIVEELKKNPGNKLELWDELKIMVFSQIITEMYSHCLLVVLLRVQISILGGYIFSEYQSSSTQGASSGAENHQKYLSHISNFFVSGIISLTFPVEEAVRKAFRGIKLGDCLKLSDFHKIFQDVFENMTLGRPEPIPDVSKYFMLPDFKDSSNNNNEEYDDFMKKIVTETKDILECDDFNSILSNSLEHGMAVLMDRVSECYMHLSTEEEVDFKNPHSVAVPLAKIIPTMHSVFENHKPNEPGSLVQTLLQQDSLKSFAANLYEAFSQD